MESKFDGGFLGYIGMYILCGLCCIIPIVGFAIGYCILLRWEIKHVVVDGARLNFTGTWGSYWCNALLWMLISITIIGLLFIPTMMARWKWKNVHVSAAPAAK